MNAQRLLEQIRQAAAEGRVVFSLHADERCEERRITAWQLVGGVAAGEVVRVQPHSRPLPSILLRQMLADGSTVEAVWGWSDAYNHAKLVTVYFPDAKPER